MEPTLVTKGIAVLLFVLPWLGCGILGACLSNSLEELRRRKRQERQLKAEIHLLKMTNGGSVDKEGGCSSIW